MMWKTRIYAQASALPAIAAALALSSTPAWSQEVQPTAEPETVTIAPPPPTSVESTPVTTDTTTEQVSEPTVATEAAPVAAKSKPKPAKATRAASARLSSATQVASTAPAAPAATATPAPATSQPIVDARPPAEQAAVAPEEPKPALDVDEDVLMLGGGALALLALGGGAFAFARRRRDEDEVIRETVAEQPMTIEPEPAPRAQVIHEEQPAIIAPSAFNWGNPQPAETQVVEPIDGETWVERAYRGPTPDNPSLSLRKRLKRANFFDARERRVAAGKAKPIEADAGLPENAANDTRERELELA